MSSLSYGCRMIRFITNGTLSQSCDPSYGLVCPSLHFFHVPTPDVVPCLAALPLAGWAQHG